MRGVNLIPAPHRAARTRRDRCRAWLTGSAIYACALLTVWGAAHLWWPDRHRAAAADLSQLQQKTRQDEATLAEIRPRIREAITTLAASRSVGDQPDWSLLLNLLSSLLGDDTVLSTCTLKVAGSNMDPSASAAPRRHLVTLTGLGRSHGAVLTYVRKLEGTGLFEAVTLIDTRQEPFTGGSQAIAFRIECSMPQMRKGQP